MRAQQGPLPQKRAGRSGERGDGKWSKRQRASQAPTTLHQGAERRDPRSYTLRPRPPALSQCFPAVARPSRNGGYLRSGSADSPTGKATPKRILKP